MMSVGLRSIRKVIAPVGSAGEMATMSQLQQGTFDI